MIVRTYDTLWKVDRRMYQIGNYVLERAPLYSQLAFTFVGLGIVVLILLVFGSLNMDYAVIKYVGIPLGFCMFMTTIKFDGKRPDRFFLSLLRFYFSPHLINRYEVVRKPESYIFRGKVLRIAELEECEKTKKKRLKRRKEVEKNGLSDTN